MNTYAEVLEALKARLAKSRPYAYRDLSGKVYEGDERREPK